MKSRCKQSSPLLLLLLPWLVSCVSRPELKLEERGICKDKEMVVRVSQSGETWIPWLYHQPFNMDDYNVELRKEYFPFVSDSSITVSRGSADIFKEPILDEISYSNYLLRKNSKFIRVQKLCEKDRICNIGIVWDDVQISFAASDELAIEDDKIFSITEAVFRCD